MNKISWLFLVLIFVASCGSTTECCVLPELLPETVEEEIVIKDWEPRAGVLVE